MEEGNSAVAKYLVRIQYIVIAIVYSYSAVVSRVLVIVRIQKLEKFPGRC